MPVLFRLAALVVLATVFAPTATLAADMPVKLTVDQRPIDRRGGSAVVRSGVVFADAVILTKTFGGLLLFDGPSKIRIDIQGTIAAFTTNSRTATIGGKATTLPGAPFLRDGDFFVPLSTVATMAGAQVKMVDSKHADLRITTFGATPVDPATRRSTALALSLVPSASVATDGLHLSLTVRNTLTTPYTLTFANAGRAAFEVLKDGATVYDSASGKRYAQSIGSVTLAPGEVVTFEDVYAGYSAATSGRYQLRARLLTAPPVVTSPISLGVATPGPAPTRS